MRGLSIQKSIIKDKPVTDSLEFSRDALSKWAAAQKGKKDTTQKGKGLSLGSPAYKAMEYIRPRLSLYKASLEAGLEEKRKSDPTADHLNEEEMNFYTKGKAKEYSDLADIYKIYRDATTIGEAPQKKDVSEEVVTEAEFNPVNGGKVFMSVDRTPKLTYYSDRGTSTLKTPQELAKEKSVVVNKMAVKKKK